MTTRNAQALRLAFVQRPHALLICLALTACSSAPQQKSPTPPTASTPATSASSPVAANPTPMPPASSSVPAVPAPVSSSPTSPTPTTTDPQPSASQPDIHAKQSPHTAPASTSAKKVETPGAGANKHTELASPPRKDAPTSNEKTKPATLLAGSKLSGHIDLVAGADQVLAASEVTQTTIYFVPSSGAPHPKPGRFNIYTREKQFDPATLVIPVGSTVSFPNKDQILHNVFSITTGATFDLGLYGEGGSADYTFKTPGLALINCNVHQAMQANVLVLDTPYFTHPDKDGQFLLDVPAGAGKLMVWHPRAAIQSSPIAGPITDPLALRLVLSKPRVVQHLNKEHKVY